MSVGSAQRPLPGDRPERRVADLDGDRRRPGRRRSAAAPATPSAIAEQRPLDHLRGRGCRRRTCARGRPTSPGRPSWTGSASTPRARRDERRRRACRTGGRRRPAAAPRGRRSCGRRSRPGRCAGPLADAPQPRDRQRREERRLLARRHDDQAVRLAQVRRDLGHELRRRDADRGGQPDLVADLVLDPARDRRAVAEQVRTTPVTSRNASSIEIGSTSGVNRRRTAITSRLRLLVAPPVDRQEHPVGAAPAGLAQRHRRVDAERARLVARRRHHAALRRVRHHRR